MLTIQNKLINFDIRKRKIWKCEMLSQLKVKVRDVKLSLAWTTFQAAFFSSTMSYKGYSSFKSPWALLRCKICRTMKCLKKIAILASLQARRFVVPQLTFWKSNSAGRIIPPDLILDRYQSLDPTIFTNLSVYPKISYKNPPF